MNRDPFLLDGVGCWCDGTLTLHTLKVMGHTEECTRARRGWEANYRNSRGMDQQRRIDAEVGRQLRESAQAVLAEKPE